MSQRIPRTFIFALSGVFAFATLVPLRAEVVFHAFVQEKHKWKSDLDGWEGSARLIERAISPSQSRVLINESPESLGTLLKAPKGAGEIRVFYLATHMHSDGRLFFTNGEEMQADQLLQRALGDDAGVVSPDLVIIDCCFGERFGRQPLWNQLFKCPHLYTCSSEEVTWQIEMNTKRPLWVKKYLPDVHSLGQTLMGASWNGKVSYFGFRLLMQLNRDGQSRVEGNPLPFFRSITQFEVDDDRILKSGRTSELIWRP